MRRAAAAVLLTCLASAPALAGVWGNLWRTPDQQGEALLAAGRPGQAATRFSSARRKAYADLEAGHYAQAARLLDPYRDATSEYNRGNALAHLGDLRGALAAYEAALKRAPHDADIRHNRDLVARMLAHQPPPPGSPGQPSQTGRSGSGSSGQSAAAGTQHPGTQPQSAQGANPGGGPHTASRSPARTARTSTPGAGRSGQGAPSPSGSTERSPANTAAAKGAGHPRTASPGQARRDAAAAAAIARQQQQGAQGRNTTPASRPGTHGPVASMPPGPHTGRSAPPKPRSEKALALDQWLRQIPNDPAGLLRRKFLIEYMMRHPERNP